MCGRYSLTAPDPGALRGRFPLGEAVEIRPRYNVAPTDPVLAVTSDRDGAPRGELLRWGLVPGWASSPAIGARMINARVETIAEKSAFRSALERRRCLIIADGFYEWQRTPNVTAARPHHITRADGAPFAFAGLWAVWHDGPVSTVRSCTIITREANAAVAGLHGRMPVILSPEAEDDWLDPRTPTAALPSLLDGLSADATAIREVSATVGDARHDAPDCLDPPAPPTQATLF